MKVSLFVSIEIKYLESLNREVLPMNYSLTWDQESSPDFETYMDNLMRTILSAESHPNDVEEIKINYIDAPGKQDVSQIKNFCKKSNIKFMNS